MRDPIRTERRGAVLEITLERPPANAIDAATSRRMSAVFAEFATDDSLRVAILTGGGEKFFSAGWDLKAAAAGAPIDDDYGSGGFGGLTEFLDLHKPVIAAVNGMAVGGGFEIALACDIIIASENATFGLPEPRVGLMAGAGGVHRLPRQMPYHAAMGVMLAGKRLSAEEAYNWGLVNEVVAPDKLLETAEHWARECMLGAPISIQATKEASTQGLAMSLQEALSTQFPTSLKMQKSEDFIEGPKAFSEKRPPNWKGR